MSKKFEVIHANLVVYCFTCKIHLNDLQVFITWGFQPGPLNALLANFTLNSSFIKRFNIDSYDGLTLKPYFTINWKPCCLCDDLFHDRERNVWSGHSLFVKTFSESSHHLIVWILRMEAESCPSNPFETFKQ